MDCIQLGIHRPLHEVSTGLLMEAQCVDKNRQRQTPFLNPSFNKIVDDQFVSRCEGCLD